MRISDNTLTLLLVLPVIFFTFSFSIYPMVYSIWMSTEEINLFKNSYLPNGFGQYVRAAYDPDFWTSAMISFRFVGEVTVLVFLLSIWIALILNESSQRKGILRILVILPWALSEFASGVIARFILSPTTGYLNSALFSVGIINKYTQFLSGPFSIEWMSIFYAWHFAPLGAFLVLASMQTIPEDLYKHAKIDGASKIRRFLTVTFPFIQYPLLLTTIMATIESGRTTDIILATLGVSTGGQIVGFAPLTYYIYKVFFIKLDLGYASAMSWILMIFIILIALTYFRALTRRR